MIFTILAISFAVDHEPPEVLNCPNQDFYAFTPEDGGRGSLVSWIEPYATDNGPFVAIDKSHEPMSSFHLAELKWSTRLLMLLEMLLIALLMSRFMVR